MTELADITLHGHRLSYRRGGSGPLLILVHGITNSSASWEPVLGLLERDFTVLAPDLLGHGDSAKPRGDYSLGANASLLRDFMVALGHDCATLVGHSLGGGIAMQMSYQFPERVERLVLVSSGGLGREVTAVLRAIALPGAEYILPLLASEPLVGAGSKVGGLMEKIGLRMGADITALWQGLASLRDISARRAFVHTARSVIDLGGQRIDATDKLYLAAAIPTLIMWGHRDPVIPAEHGVRAHELMPGSRLELFERAGHFPHHDEPIAFAAALADFVATTEPSRGDGEPLRQLLIERARVLAAQEAARGATRRRPTSLAPRPPRRRRPRLRLAHLDGPILGSGLREARERFAFGHEPLLHALGELAERLQPQRRQLPLDRDRPSPGDDTVEEERRADAEVLRRHARAVLVGDHARAVVVGEHEVVELGQEARRGVHRRGSGAGRLGGRTARGRARRRRRRARRACRRARASCRRRPTTSACPSRLPARTRRGSARTSAPAAPSSASGSSSHSSASVNVGARQSPSAPLVGDHHERQERPHRVAERAVVDVGELLLQARADLVERQRAPAQQLARRWQHGVELEALRARAEHAQRDRAARLQRHPHAA